MICFLDMDGVIADFATAACLAHGRISPYRQPENLGQFDMEKLWGISVEEFWKPINTPGFWYEIPKMPEADAIVALVEEFFGKEVVILTAPSHNPHCYLGKRDWIARNFPQFKNRIIFAAASAKKFMAGEGRFLIDDRDKNLDQFAEAGGIPVCVPRPWNSLHGITTPVVEYLRRELEFYGAGSSKPVSKSFPWLQESRYISDFGRVEPTPGQEFAVGYSLGEVSEGPISCAFTEPVGYVGAVEAESTAGSNGGPECGTPDEAGFATQSTQLGDDIPF
jgi:5'(3')-deoxyribonucleotidase